MVGLSVGMASMNLVQSSVLPGADAMEARVAGFGRDQGLGGRGGALGGRGVSWQRRHGVCLCLGERHPVVWAVWATSQPAVKLTQRKVSKETIRPPRGTIVGL